jgi:hypothetical protein
MQKYFLLILIVLIVSISCNQKNQLIACCEVLNTANIVGTYEIVGVKLKLSANSPYVDAYNTPTTFAQCRKDDLLSFYLNGTFANNDGTIVCNPSNNNSSGTWSLNGNTLITTGNYNTEQFAIENYTCTTMDLKIIYQIIHGTSTILYNLKRH